MKQQISIQILRGIAAFGVLLFHFSFIGGPDVQVDGPNPFRFGSAGVDIFFVLSGFVMWHVTSNQSVDMWTFWKARFVRIAPLYYLYTALFALVLFAHEGYVFPLSDVLLTLLFIPFTNSHVHQPVPILGAGWTLNYEALFYLLFGCSLVLPRRAWRFATLTAALAALICLRPFGPADNALALRFTSPLLMEFVMGMVIAAQITRIQQLPRAASLLLLSVAIGLLLAGPSIWPHAPRTIVAGLPGALLVTAALALEDLLKEMQWLKPLHVLGDASYSLYLAHGVILALIEWYAPPSLKTMAALPIWLACALLAAIASYHLIEKPLLKLMRPVFSSSKKISGLPYAPPSQ